MLVDRGLNLTDLDSWTPEEQKEFAAFYAREKGHALPGFDFWAEYDPSALKRLRMQARMAPSPGELALPKSNLLAWVHYYSIIGYEEGILYEIRSLQSIGCSKAAIVATLAVAFIHAGPRGSSYMAKGARDYLRTYEEPEPSGWPENWDVDPGAFRSGLDFGVPELQDGELGLLEQWFKEHGGEVPEYVSFLAEFRPNLLKAARGRFENAIKDRMPKQMMPYLQLHWNTIRGNADGIREAALIGRSFGMTRSQMTDAIIWGIVYGGPQALSIASKAAKDVLSSVD